MLALAHAVDRIVDTGRLRDHTDAAFVLGITRGRMSQIANLALLAPDIQDAILSGRLRTTERNLRCVLGTMDWSVQRTAALQA